MLLHVIIAAVFLLKNYFIMCLRLNYNSNPSGGTTWVRELTGWVLGLPKLISFYAIFLQHMFIIKHFICSVPSAAPKSKPSILVAPWMVVFFFINYHVFTLIKVHAVLLMLIKLKLVPLWYLSHFTIIHLSIKVEINCCGKLA